ncbi:YggS family pyridoxal phosphate-dependent enzyme [Glutamicibacter sp. 287]|uniref:YggS family pyridoxal phosphate-dependent enzyme n=1 Tax=unclassified Glutamicibacter TaxID=2627139 RepID=UPI000BB7144D|nr:YggS family pyridoxal phosphate-dependent enzyme [Glutamicibacter sp. BW80]PCC29209.1 YggS family pyridoxal phosphate-dependent enzyme [Glutamicibacter sp. BW80]
MSQATSDSSAAPTANTVAQYKANLASVRKRIAAAELAAGREPGSVRLLPVTKTVPEERLRLAIAAGVDWLGENKVQEAARKAQNLADIPGLKYSVIGHLQSNKAKDVARFADEFQALDNLRQATALQRRLELEDRTLDVFVQVNTSGEETKFGLDPAAAPEFLRSLPGLDRLRVKGLMTLAIFSSEKQAVRTCFTTLRELRDRLRERAPEGIGLEELSMGMSGDFELAIAEGATVVRVGQGIFGARALPDSHYWPGFAG